MNWFDAYVAEGWEMEDAGDLLETLSASEDWSSCFVLAADLGLFFSLVQSVKYMAVQRASTCAVAETEEGSPTRPVRRRLHSKQQLTPCFRFASCRPTACTSNSGNRRSSTKI